MAELPDDKRQGPDRRRHPRGGRRPSDVPGYTPLVYVVDPRPVGRETCEAILAKLRFAVAPFDTVDKARHAVSGLKPDIVLVVEEHLDELRRALPPGRDGKPIPILPLSNLDLSPAALVDAIRQALHIRV